MTPSADGEVIGIDMTNEQLDKAAWLRQRDGFKNISFRKAYIEEAPLADASADVVISNGVINLSPVKRKVFDETAACSSPADDSPSRTSSPKRNFPKASCAMQSSGPPASAARRSRTPTAR